MRDQVEINEKIFFRFHYIKNIQIVASGRHQEIGSGSLHSAAKKQVTFARGVGVVTRSTLSLLVHMLRKGRLQLGLG